MPNVNLVRYMSSHPDCENSDISVGDTKVIIENGELLAGILCKRTLGPNPNGLTHVAWLEHGPAVTRDFITQTHALMNQWMFAHGFTFGIEDMIVDRSVHVAIDRSMHSAKTKAHEIITQAQLGHLECVPGRTLAESVEHSLKRTFLCAQSTAASRVTRGMKEESSLKVMMTAGSFPSPTNVAQIAACMGQQLVDEKRIPFGFLDRTLPHFQKFDLGPASRGFVENSLLHGLTAQEFFFHAMAARDKMLKKEKSISELGRIQNNLMREMEDVSVTYDATVRDAQGRVVQFVYGEDGMDALWMESQRLDIIRMDDSVLEKRYKFQEDRSPKVLNEVRTDREVRAMLDEEFAQIEADRRLLRETVFPSLDSMWPLACNAQRLIWNAQKKFPIDARAQTDLRPCAVIEGIQLLIARLSITPKNGYAYETHRAAINLFAISLRSVFASKRVLEEYRLDSRTFAWVVGELESRFARATAQPGEMVGAICAQAIVECAMGAYVDPPVLFPLFFAGVYCTNVTIGLPRLKEILDLEIPAQPSASVFLKPHCSRDSEAAKRAQHSLVHTSLRGVTIATSIHYDPDAHNTNMAEDAELVVAYWDFPVFDSLNVEFSPWLLRFEIDREAMTDAELSMGDINDLIEMKWPDDVHSIYSDDNAENLVMRIRMIRRSTAHELDADDDELNLVLDLEAKLLDLTLKGIPSLPKVFMREDCFTCVGEHGRPETKREWVLNAEGNTALREILASHDVDDMRSSSNDIMEMYEIFGIEAARSVIIRELRNVISYDGSYVNIRHLATLADVMTYRGHVTPVARHTTDRDEMGVFARSLRGGSTDDLVRAAIFCERDRLRGITEKNLFGQLAPLGTGCFDILLDDESRFANVTPRHGTS